MATETKPLYKPGSIYRLSRRTGLCLTCGQNEEAHHHPGLRATCPPPDDDQARREAMRLHREGTAQHGIAWLGANVAVTTIARECGLDPSADGHLALALTRIAGYICGDPRE